MADSTFHSSEKSTQEEEARRYTDVRLSRIGRALSNRGVCSAMRGVSQQRFDQLRRQSASARPEFHLGLCRQARVGANETTADLCRNAGTNPQQCAARWMVRTAARPLTRRPASPRPPAPFSMAAAARAARQVRSRATAQAPREETSNSERSAAASTAYGLLAPPVANISSAPSKSL
jgi:hypothetical protein